jgi:hypothetical protein
MQETKVSVTSVDAPSSWNIEEGPPKSGVGSSFHPDVLVSLTAPKPLVKFFAGRHFIGGRYVRVFRLSHVALPLPLPPFPPPPHVHPRPTVGPRPVHLTLSHQFRHTGDRREVWLLPAGV